MDFSKMSGRNKILYDSIWGGRDKLDVDIELASDSRGSVYKLKGDPNNASKAIKTAFEIKNPAKFDKMYKQAVGGQGQEEKKILTLHSSSRCSLLCFCNVGDENPFTLNIEGEPVKFDYLAFEFKNPVIGYPSNMDVVLLSEDRKKVLFLESKFAEYYLSASNKSSLISDTYKKESTTKKERYSKTIYDRIGELGLKVDDEPQYIRKKNRKETGEVAKAEIAEGKFRIQIKENRSETNDKKPADYLDGIKQMISHYYGIMRRLDGDKLKSDSDPESKDIYSKISGVINDPESRVYLGEILFDKFDYGSEKDGPKEALKNYSELYRKLAKLLNDEIAKHGRAEKFKVLEADFKYSEVMKANADKIDKKVLEFYGIMSAEKW